MFGFRHSTVFTCFQMMPDLSPPISPPVNAGYSEEDYRAMLTKIASLQQENVLMQQRIQVQSTSETRARSDLGALKYVLFPDFRLSKSAQKLNQFVRFWDVRLSNKIFEQKARLFWAFLVIKKFI